MRNREFVLEMDPEERLEKLTEYMESCDLILRKQTDMQAKFQKAIENIHSRLNSGQLSSTGESNTICSRVRPWHVFDNLT